MGTVRQKMKPFALGNTATELMLGVAEALGQWETFIPKPTHKDLVEEWKNEFKDYVATVYPLDENDVSAPLVRDITDGLLAAYDLWKAPLHTEAVAHEDIHALMNRPQTTQRSESWYEQFKNQLTASEFYKITAAPRERGTLVLQKAGKIDISGRQSHVPTYRGQMIAFDWGICLEPVVKQILESDWDAMIQDVGRFNHPTDPRLAASPDGLLLKCGKHPEKAGHLVEIKCPKSRKIGVKIPIEYFFQMQLQMEVTGMRACEYVEMKFDLVAAETFDPKAEANAGKLFGKAVLAGCFCEEKAEWIPCKYVYGPIGEMDWVPELGLNEQTLETSVWIRQGWHHEIVHRDEAWFASMKLKIDAFWEDVERARIGEFVLPESTRKRKEKVIECLIQDEESEPASTPNEPKPENLISE
jgi:hypothetical protein